MQRLNERQLKEYAVCAVCKWSVPHECKPDFYTDETPSTVELFCGEKMEDKIDFANGVIYQDFDPDDLCLRLNRAGRCDSFEHDEIKLNEYRLKRNRGDKCTR